MGINYIADIAKLLGVELDKEFNIKDSDYNPYKITDKGLVDCDGDIRDSLLMGLLKGNFEIIKKPWVPEEDEPYWYLTHEGYVATDRFKNDFITSVHHMRVRLGNFFKTKQEAESYKEKWLAYYNQGADMSWRA